MARMTVATLPGQDWIDDVGPVPGLELLPWDMDGVPPRADEVRVVVHPYMGAAGRIPGSVLIPM